jgi:hypothetical protein
MVQANKQHPNRAFRNRFRHVIQGRMNGRPGAVVQVLHGIHIQAIVDVSSIGGATTGRDDAAFPQFLEVIGHQVHGLVKHVDQFVDTGIGLDELLNDFPP